MNINEKLRFTILDIEVRQFQFFLQSSGMAKDIYKILTETLNKLREIEDQYEKGGLNEAMARD